MSNAAGLKAEMVAFLGEQFSDVDSFDVEAAIYWYANDYHGGQWTPLYSILSCSPFQPGPSHRGAEDEEGMAAEMYAALVERFE